MTPDTTPDAREERKHLYERVQRVVRLNGHDCKEQTVVHTLSRSHELEAVRSAIRAALENDQLVRTKRGSSQWLTTAEPGHLEAAAVQAGEAGEQAAVAHLYQTARRLEGDDEGDDE